MHVQVRQDLFLVLVLRARLEYFISKIASVSHERMKKKPFFLFCSDNVHSRLELLVLMFCFKMLLGWVFILSNKVPADTLERHDPYFSLARATMYKKLHFQLLSNQRSNVNSFEQRFDIVTSILNESFSCLYIRLLAPFPFDPLFGR